MPQDRVPQHKRRLATDKEDMGNSDKELKEKVSKRVESGSGDKKSPDSGKKKD